MPAMSFSRIVGRWLPALIMMVLIFLFSSLPASRIPYFGRWDFLIKKSSHALGYALLGLAYFGALPRSLSPGFRWTTALFMAVLFALSDEFHQSFVEGRTSALRDVAIDSLGAVVALGGRLLYSSNSSSSASV
jgi:VanZ family protein